MTLFSTEEEKERKRQDPRFQELEERVMRQFDEAFARARAATSANHTETKTEIGRSKPTHIADATRGSFTCAVPGLNLMCTCGADEDGAHTPDCPLFDESATGCG